VHSEKNGLFQGKEREKTVLVIALVLLLLGHQFGSCSKQAL
jgi:hypothetical protein